MKRKRKVSTNIREERKEKNEGERKQKRGIQSNKKERKKRRSNY